MPEVKGNISVVVSCDEPGCFRMRALPTDTTQEEAEQGSRRYGWKTDEYGKWYCPNHTGGIE